MLSGNSILRTSTLAHRFLLDCKKFKADEFLTNLHCRFYRLHYNRFPIKYKLLQQNTSRNSISFARESERRTFGRFWSKSIKWKKLLFQPRSFQTFGRNKPFHRVDTRHHIEREEDEGSKHNFQNSETRERNLSFAILLWKSVQWSNTWSSNIE